MISTRVKVVMSIVGAAMYLGGMWWFAQTGDPVQVGLSLFTALFGALVITGASSLWMEP